MLLGEVMDTVTHVIAHPLVVAICIGIYYQQEHLIGTVADYNNIIHTFKNIYKLDVLYATDHGRPKFAWTMSEIFDFISSIKNFNLDMYDSLILFISAHGKQNQVLDSNSEPVLIEKIKEQFNGEKCPGLSKKPQFFFVDSCRHVTQNYINTNSNNNDNNAESSTATDKADNKMDEDLDMVWTIFSTETNRNALESNKFGGYLVHSVTKLFANNYNYDNENQSENVNDNLATILNKLASHMEAMGAKPPIIEQLHGIKQKNVIFDLQKQTLQTAHVHGKEICVEIKSNVVCLFMLFELKLTSCCVLFVHIGVVFVACWYCSCKI